MSKQNTAWETAEAAAETIAPEFSLVTQLDSGDFGKSLGAVMQRAATNPGAVVAAHAALRHSAGQDRACGGEPLVGVRD